MRLGVQSGASIGTADGGLARIRVRGLKGRMTRAEALRRLLRGTGATGRATGPDSFVIERSTRFRLPQVHDVIASKSMPAAPDDMGVPIVVLSSRRGVTLDKYAGSVAIIDGAGIQGVEASQGSDALEAYASEVTSTHLGPGRNKLFIRGIADSSLVGSSQATVGQYWGEARINYSGPDPSLRLYDVERVEILAGGQGTLYGSGSLGGVIRITPNAPRLDEVRGSTWLGRQITAHGETGGDLGAIVNLPFVEERMALRVVGYTIKEGGWIDDRLRKLKDINQVATHGVRATLRVRPDDCWHIDLGGLAQVIRGADSQYADRVDALSRAASRAEPFENRYHLVSLAAERRGSDNVFTTTLTSARQRSGELRIGPDAPEPSGLLSIMRSNGTALELRMAHNGQGGHSWVAGLAYWTNLVGIRRDVLGDATTTRARLDTDTSEISVFGEAAHVLAEGLTATVGGRASQARTSGILRRTADGVTVTQEDRRRSAIRALPSATLSYRPTPGTWMVFVRYEHGFRPGGLGLHQNLVRRFEGDKLRSLSVGSRIGGERLNADISLSFNRWRDIQADVIDELGFASTTNIGTGAIVSVTAKVHAAPVPGMVLDGSLTRNKARLTEPKLEILPFRQIGSSGDNLPNVADLTARFAAGYNWGLGGASRCAICGWARYTGKSVLGIGPTLGRLQGGYVDNGVEVRLDSGRAHYVIRA